MTTYIGKKYGASDTKKFDFVIDTCPPLEPTLNFFNLPPKNQDHSAWVNSCPKTYAHFGSGRNRYMRIQHSTPTSTVVQIVSALPLIKTICHNATTEPRQNCKRKIEIMIRINLYKNFTCKL